MKQNKWSEHLDFESCLALSSIGLPVLQNLGVYIIPVFFMTEVYEIQWTTMQQNKWFEQLDFESCLALSSIGLPVTQNMGV